MVPINKIFVTLGKGQYMVKVKIEGEKPIYIITATIINFNCNRSMRYVQYEVVTVNGIMLKKSLITFGIAQFKVKVKTESEKHIYIIPAACIKILLPVQFAWFCE